MSNRSERERERNTDMKIHVLLFLLLLERLSDIENELLAVQRSTKISLRETRQGELNVGTLTTAMLGYREEITLRELLLHTA